MCYTLIAQYSSLRIFVVSTSLIKAKTFVMPFAQDMFFPVYHCEREQKLIPNSEFRPIPSLWGHFAMFGIFEEDKKAIDDVLKELLAVPA